MTLLEAAYKRIKLRTSSVDEAILHQVPSKGEWSIVEILVHLRACADVWAYSIDAMLTLDQPTLAHIHPRDWAAIKIYRKQPSPLKKGLQIVTKSGYGSINSHQK